MTGTGLRRSQRPNSSQAQRGDDPELVDLQRRRVPDGVGVGLVRKDLAEEGERQGLFALFDRERDADAFIVASPVMQAYRNHAGELCIAKLRATASRGSWSGQGIAVTAAPAAGGRVASLTRASIRPHKAWAFWRNSPPAEAALERAEGCLLAMGLGEAPLLRQATFSVWESQAAMDAYARSGAHLAAFRAAYGQNQFSESMFVRYALLQLSGTWKGRTYG